MAAITQYFNLRHYPNSVISINIAAITHNILHHYPNSVIFGKIGVGV